MHLGSGLRLVVGQIANLADGLGSFDVDQLALVAQPAVEQLHHGSTKTGILLDKLGGQTDQHETGCRALDNSGCTVLLDHLDQSHTVVRAHLVEQTNSMVLSHEVCVCCSQTVRGRGTKAKGEAAGRLCARSSLLSLALPAANNVASNGEQVIRGHKGGRGDGGSLVDDGRLDVALNGLDSGSVDDTTQSSDGVGTVYDVASDSRILHDTAGNHNDILGGVGKLLDDQVDHLAEGGIFVLEQLGNAEEEGGGFILRKLFTSHKQEGDFGEQNTAFARRNGRRVEDASYRGLVSDM